MGSSILKELMKRFPALYAAIELDKGLKTFPVCTVVAFIFTFILKPPRRLW